MYMQSVARWHGMKPIILARHKHGTAWCFMAPGRPDPMHRAVLGPLLRHARRHGPARQLTSARWLL